MSFTNKKSWILVLLLLALLVFPAMQASPTSVRAIAFGEPLTSATYVGNHIYVAAAEFAVKLGYRYDWNASAGVIHFNSEPYLNNYTDSMAMYQGYPVLQVVINNEQTTPTPPAVLLQSKPYVPLRLAAQAGIYVGWHAETQTAYIGSRTTSQLPRVGSQANLEKMLAQNFGGYYRYEKATAEAGAMPPSQAATTDRAGAPSHSTTNVQVSGIDESDIVKTDGNYIYQVRASDIVISRAYPVADMKVLGHISFATANFQPLELFLEEDYLLVIGQSYNLMVEPKVAIGGAPSLMPDARWWPAANPQVSAKVYDVSDRTAPKLLREVELEGSFLSARKLGTRIVLLTNRYLYGGDPTPPHYRDTLITKEQRPFALSQVYYFPGGNYQSYLLTACFDLTDTVSPAAVNAYLGAGENVYMSEHNLYVSLPAYGYEDTAIYKFSLAGLDLSFAAKGKVPGQLLNQFSLDEYADHLRVATTAQRGNTTQNNVYVLDANLNLAGSIENIAPGERIYAARFMGSRGYLVTFFQVDPLFALDLSDPKNPRVLGALKIPGFSTYLHPIDEKHLLGIGRDTTLMEHKDSQGRIISTQVLEAGIKLSIFDISDINQPLEKHSIILGGRGSYSQGLYNHKAVLFDQERNLLALPVSLTKAHPDPWSYGSYVFQGAIVWQADPLQGIKELGRISHLSPDQLATYDYYGYMDLAQIERMLLIDGSVYAVSGQRISAHQLPDLKQLGSIQLP